MLKFLLSVLIPILFSSSLICGLFGPDRHFRLIRYCRLYQWDKAIALIEKKQKPFSADSLTFAMERAFFNNQPKLLSKLIDKNNGVISKITYKTILHALEAGYVEIFEVGIKGGLRPINLYDALSLSLKSKRAYEMFQVLLDANENYLSNGKKIFDLEERPQKTDLTILGKAIVAGELNIIGSLILERNACLLNAVIVKNSKDYLELIDSKYALEILYELWFSTQNLENLKNILEKIENPREVYLLLDFFSYPANKFFKTEIEQMKLEFRRKQIENASSFILVGGARNLYSKVTPVCLDICDGSKEEWQTLEICGHQLCVPCMNEHISSSKENSINCFVSGCNGQLLENDLAKFNISKERISELKIKFLENTLSQINFYTRCKKADCPGGSLSKHHYEAGTTHIECNICGEYQCIECGKHHPFYYCAEKNEELSIETLSNLKIKICPNPNCKMPIQKYEGCDNMFCSACKQYFNWLSAKSPPIL